MSTTAVLPIVNTINAYGGIWPDVADLIINPSYQASIWKRKEFITLFTAMMTTQTTNH